jgi:hypothetical protein
MQMHIPIFKKEIKRENQKQENILIEKKT